MVTAQNDLFISASTVTCNFTATWHIDPGNVICNWTQLLTWEGIVDRTDLLREQFRFRLAIYRKMLFNRKDKTKILSHKTKPMIQLKIPSKRTFNGKESRRR